MDNDILSAARLGLLAYAPLEDLTGGYKTHVLHLKQAFPQLETFPKEDWFSKQSLTKLRFKTWYLDQFKNDLVFSHILKKWHRKNPFHLLFTLPRSGLLLNPKKLGIPIICLFQGCWIEFVNQTAQNKREAFIEKLIAGYLEKRGGRGKYCTVVSERAKIEIKKYYGYDCHVIPNGVDTHVFQPQCKQEARQSLALNEKIPIGLFVGRPERAKGWDVLLEVAQALPEITWLCITEKKIASPFKNIFVRQICSTRELQIYYNAADFFFLPSRYESSSYVTLEAMSTNRPVIISHCVECIPPSCPIGSKEGLYVVSEGIQGYIQAIQACLKNSGSPQTRTFVEKNFSLENFRKKFRQLVCDLLNRGCMPVHLF